jgi:midasin
LWDRLEYYWTRAATESTQRKLHKLTRHAQDVLKQPVAAILAWSASAMGFQDLKPLPDAAVSIPNAVSDARDVISAAETAKKKRRAAGIRPAKGAVAKLLKKKHAAQQTAGEPAEATAQRAAADAALAAEAAAQRKALRVRVLTLWLVRLGTC